MVDSLAVEEIGQLKQNALFVGGNDFDDIWQQVGLSLFWHQYGTRSVSILPRVLVVRASLQVWQQRPRIRLLALLWTRHDRLLLAGLLSGCSRYRRYDGSRRVRGTPGASSTR